MSIVVLCPSRNRPDAARHLADSFENTAELDSSRLLFVIDEDDETKENYQVEYVSPRHQGGMVNALNSAVAQVLKEEPQVIGFVGDDHRFRTVGWDTIFEQALHDRPGFVYGNDLFWPNGEIPTQIFVSASVLKSLGWMGLPGCKHLFIDNAWRELGDATGSIRYYPEIVIEHLHPAAGKALWDDGHKRVNTPEIYGHDGAVFAEWRNSDRFMRDVDLVSRAITTWG